MWALCSGPPDEAHSRRGYELRSLGQGISAACGIALAGKLKKADWRVFTILGDGEIEEGQVWEAAMFAAHHKLDNLVAVVDNNNLQIDGRVSDVCSVYPIDEKFAPSAGKCLPQMPMTTVWMRRLLRLRPCRASRRSLSRSR